MKHLGLILVLATLARSTHAQCACGSTELVVVIGDSRSSNRGDGQTPWPEQVTEVAMLNVATINFVWTQCVAAPPFNTSEMAIQCGVNDLLAGANGNTLWTTVQNYVTSRSAHGLRTWVMNIPGFKGYDNTPSKLTQRNNFNAAFATWCLSPTTGATCIDIDSLLWNPADHDALLAPNTIDFIHYSTAGHTIIKNAFEAAHP